MKRRGVDGALGVINKRRKKPPLFIEGVKKVVLSIEGGVYERLKGDLGLKIAMGNFHGLQDELTKIIISTIEKGDDAVTVWAKEGKKR